MEFEESIYNLIPKEKYEPPRQKRHKSQHPHNIPPTATTFCLKTTSKPGVGNLNGDYQPEGSNHNHKAENGTFGKALGASKNDTTNFRKKGTGTIVLPEKQKYAYTTDRKAAVPKKDEKPIMGLVSDKNYIVANAVENILAGILFQNLNFIAPKLQSNDQKDYLKKKNYGKVPNFLSKIKREIEDEYQLVREMQIEEENQRDREKFLMNDAERNDLIAALKMKWDIVHKEYQTLTHKTKLDTIGMKNRKEGCEKELQQLEKDIALLSKNYIFVDTNFAQSVY